MVVMITGIEFSQEIFAINYVEDYKILFEASSEACSVILTTIWRPDFRISAICFGKNRISIPCFGIIRSENNMENNGLLFLNKYS